MRSVMRQAGNGFVTIGRASGEGRAQVAQACVGPIGQARDDWKILRALSEVVGTTLPYDSLEGVRARLGQIAPHFLPGSVDAVETWSSEKADATLAALEFAFGEALVTFGS